VVGRGPAVRLPKDEDHGRLGSTADRRVGPPMCPPFGSDGLWPTACSATSTPQCPAASGGFWGCGGRGTRTVWGTAGRSGLGGRSCFGCWVHGIVKSSSGLAFRWSFRTAEVDSCRRGSAAPAGSMHRERPAPPPLES
jgi:hypothetical protein